MRESRGATPPGSPAPPTTTAYVPPGPITSTDTDGYGMPGKDVILPGTFSPGHSPGSALYGSLTLLDTSYLIMEIAGRKPGEFDHISVDGHLTFDGTLDLRLAKSESRYYYLKEGETFSFRENSQGQKTGTFADMTSWFIDSLSFRDFISVC